MLRPPAVVLVVHALCGSFITRPTYLSEILLPMTREMPPPLNRPLPSFKLFLVNSSCPDLSIVQQSNSIQSAGQ